MKILHFDILEGFKKGGITQFENDNLNETYKIYLYKNKMRFDVDGKTIRFVMLDKNKAGQVLTLKKGEASNEIILPVTKELTKIDGVYDAQIIFTKTDGYNEKTIPFRVTIKNDLLTDMESELVSKEEYQYLVDRFEEAVRNIESFKVEIRNEYSELEDDLNNKYNDFKSEVNSNINVIDEKVNKFDDRILSNTKEINNAKGEYDTLKTRLDKENEKIYETINEKDFLPFEGENVTIEHSKVGYTKDMGIEGMIYQNFSPLKEITIKSGEGERTPVVDMLMPIHPGVKVTISFDLLNNDIQNNTYFRFKTKTGNFINACTISPNDKNKKIIYTVNDEIVSIAPYVQSEDFTNNKGFKIDNLIILTGEHEYIPPYFEGIKSVGEKEGKISILSTGKNLFNAKKLQGYGENFTLIDETTNTFTINNHKNDVDFIPYQEDKKEIPLPFESGFKGFPNGSKDTTVIKEDGLYIRQKVGKVILNDSNANWVVSNGGLADRPNTLYFSSNVIDSTIKKQSTVNGLSDRFVEVSTLYTTDVEGYHFVNMNYHLRISIARSKLETQDIAGFKKWLQQNPTTIYYELETPIDYKIADLNSINLETFKDITHVFSENSISPNLSFKAPVDVSATISSLRTKNESLEQENKELKEEVSVKTLKLHGQDVELTNSDLDLDFRIFELEMSMGLPINLNVKGVKSMARSPFEMMKILILNNNYDREDIEYKASKYLKGGRMSQAEYNEIISLMDANEVIQ